MSDDLQATRIIPDLPSSLVEYSKNRLKLQLARGLKPKGTYNGAEVYTFGDNGDGYIFLFKDGKILYFVRYKKIRYSGWSIGRQVLLWRDPSAGTVVGGFAQHVFFNVLLPKYGALIADKEQTNNGALFWSNAIQGAFARKLKVYFYDRRGSVSLKELKSQEDVHAVSHDLWGTDAAHLYTFAVISQKKIVLRATKKN